jgi:outer membrane protein OmpA-like peptidoglycan-associated protein
METLNSSLTTIEGKAGQVGSTVQFRTGQTGVRDSDKARLAKLGALVAGLPDVRVRVSGFADARGDETLNLSLSQERAEMVARELEKAGVPKERMVIEAMGERFASTDAVADDQAFERCVEIRLESGQALASN